jgi:hypothetical protein
MKATVVRVSVYATNKAETICFVGRIALTAVRYMGWM